MNTRGMDFDVLVTVEHAKNDVPEDIELGVGRDVLESHVAWDPGAAVIGEILAEGLGVPLMTGTLTRLVADLNRNPTNREVVPEIAFGVPIPGNQQLDEAGRAERINRFHTPYWKRVRAWVEEHLADRPVLHLSIHSFTEVLHNEVRSMSVGIMYDPSRPLERPLAAEMIRALRDQGLDTADNGPYDGRADALTTHLRAALSDRPYAGIQIEHNLKHMPHMAELGQQVLVGLQNALATGRS